ncbi:LuxR C-terminal-related transcriptional regulator [Streptacidiphilus sp. EB129]|uniref:LuxR C-terminal-related transcriptional regulator n=1 Tax=Streptacidiphilus sp. EB129 TaxID=3156262 RepID=UPI0035182143
MTTDPGSQAAGPAKAASWPEDPVLTGRLHVPSVPGTFVHRARLADRLTCGVREHPLVMVNGPAGAGKTLLVSDWARTSPPAAPLAWLTVEDEDDDPGLFWSHLRQALRGAGVPTQEAATTRRAEQADRPAVRLAAELAELRTPVVIVLDEFERVTNPVLATGLEFLLSHAEGWVHLVLVSRNEPLLPLHRHRVADEITEIRAVDLAFSAAETSALLRLHGLVLPAAGVRSLNERTQGWAAGLRLWALAAASAPDCERYLKEFEPGHSTIADFLLCEVLDAQPAETQDLLLRTSILDRIHPALADALTEGGNAERTLDDLARANAFVTPLNGSWYRQHPLFAEILQVHLRARCPGLQEELHVVAAHWLREAGQLDEALRHAVAADRWELAADWFIDDLAVEQFFSATGTGPSAALLARMPAGVAGASAELVRAAGALAADDSASGLEHLERAAAGSSGVDGTRPSARLSAAFLRLEAGRLTGSGEAAEEAAETVEQQARCLPADRWDEHRVLAVRRLTNLAAVRLWEGQCAFARSTLLAALAQANGAQYPERSAPLALLALVESLSGATGRAEARARQVVAETEHGGIDSDPEAELAHLVLAQIAVDRGDLSSARLSARRAAASRAGQGRDPLKAFITALVRSRLALRQGNPQQALSELAAAEHPGAAAPSPWARGLTALAASEALVMAGDAQAAVEVLSDDEGTGAEHALAVARAHLAAGERGKAAEALAHIPAGAPAAATRSLLLRAELSAADGDDACAQRLVTRALATARPDRLFGPFLESGPWLARFLRRRPALTGAHSWLQEPLRCPSKQAPVAAEAAEPGAAEPLSSRELEVLELVAQLMSTAEVAADLHVSVNTVKTHLKSINRKLCTSRRAEAVRRARRLHLL